MASTSSTTTTRKTSNTDYDYVDPIVESDSNGSIDPPFDNEIELAPERRPQPAHAPFFARPGILAGIFTTFIYRATIKFVLTHY